MDMNTLKVYIYGFIMLTLIGGISAIALTAFRDSETVTAGSYADNITVDGLQGIGNTTAQFPTAGTILGVALLLGIVFSAFYMLQKR